MIRLVDLPSVKVYADCLQDWANFRLPLIYVELFFLIKLDFYLSHCEFFKILRYDIQFFVILATSIHSFSLYLVRSSSLVGLYENCWLTDLGNF